MNVVFADQFSEPGGAQLALLDVLEEALSRSWNAHLLAPGSGFLVEKAASNGVPVSTLSLRQLTNGSKGGFDTLRYLFDLPQAARELRRAIALHSADILYVNGPRVLPAAVGLSIPVIFHAHNVVSGPALGLLTRALKTTRATLIAASSFAAHPLRHSACSGCQIVYNGAPDFHAFAREDLHTTVRVGVVGRLAPEKGHLDFVHACRTLSNENASFKIYGDCMIADPRYEKQLRNAALDSNIRFEPWRDDVATIYRELDILAVPSQANEASTRVIIEAFSAGVAVVAYPSGGIPELIDHGRTGLLTQSPDASELAEALRLLIRNRLFRTTLAEAARQEWSQRFTRRDFQRSVCDVIAATCSGHDPATRASPRYQSDKTQQGGHVRMGS